MCLNKPSNLVAPLKVKKQQPYEIDFYVSYKNLSSISMMGVRQSYNKIEGLFFHNILPFNIHLHIKYGMWDQCFETFYVRNLIMFVISWSVCLWLAFPT
jgi:hypothetical protein